MSSTNSRGNYIQKPTTIIQSRGSSVESRTSSSRSSTDGNDTSSRRSMANSEGIVEKLRVPDNMHHFIETKSNSKVKIIHQDKGIYDPQAPHASSATSGDYKYTQDEHRERQRRKARK